LPSVTRGWMKKKKSINCSIDPKQHFFTWGRLIIRKILFLTESIFLMILKIFIFWIQAGIKVQL
jgi:hypothetical protein